MVARFLKGAHREGEIPRDWPQRRAKSLQILPGGGGGKSGSKIGPGTVHWHLNGHILSKSWYIFELRVSGNFSMHLE